MSVAKRFSNSIYINRTLQVLFILIFCTGYSNNPIIVTGAEPTKDMLQLLETNDLNFKVIPLLNEALNEAEENSGILITASQAYQPQLSESNLEIIRIKKLRVFIEFPNNFSSLFFKNQRFNINKERGVITSNKIKGLQPMDIIGLNTETIVLLENRENLAKEDLLAVLGKVAGFDFAEYGLDDVEYYPLLFHHDEEFLVSTSILSSAIKGRYGPTKNWVKIFEYIFSWLTDKQVVLNNYPIAVKPSFRRHQILPPDADSTAIINGADWFYNAKLLVHPTWEHLYYENTAKDGKEVVHSPVADSVPVGNGSLGILEGHSSRINPDGSQPYRWWIRADCQAESAYALTTAYNYNSNPEYLNTAKELLNYVFETSNLRADKKNDPGSPSFGLIGWATTDADAYFGDDNARFLLSLIGASTNMKMHDWDEKLLEGIIGNFRTAGKKGFRGPWFRDAGMQETTWQELGNRDIVNVHPHYESWLWALYLWLYDKTGEERLYDKAHKAIGITMETHPEWKWTNGITQEYARMILPLAWLVRVKDTPEHRKWLDIVITQLLKGLEESGAITERLGPSGLGRYEKIQSNGEYGTKEAPLISSESDKVADLLYTMNFSLFSLNEAAHATGNEDYAEVTDLVADFLVRIQIDSEDHKDLNGAWYRAFDEKGWEYWASNADSDWGPWGTLTGWTQSWIINGLSNNQKNRSLWESSGKHYTNSNFLNLSKKKIQFMLNN